MRILVSGGCGFLGSHIVDRLVAEGHEIDVVDNLWTGTKEFLNPGAAYLFADVCDIELGAWADVSDKFDHILHLASPASPEKYMADPVGTMRANFVGALALRPLLRDGGRFCFTSTSEVYGDPLVSPLPESYRGSVSCTGPRSSYDESKRATEALLHELRRTQGLDIRCARIFNAYGPRTQPDDGRAVSNFVTAALRGEDLVVYGDGSQTRCFTYVDCIVEGLLRYFWLEPRPYQIDLGHGNVGEDVESVPTTMNIGCDRETTVLEIARHVADQLGVGIRHERLPFDDPKQRKPDLTQARDWMPDWDPHAVPYEEGIRRTIEHFRQRGVGA